jgi:hypothetical protein
MRILHLDGGKEMRGGQWQVLRLIEGLGAAGIESTLLARPGGPLFAAAQEKGWRLERLGLRRLATLAREHDLIHAHDARGHTVGAIVGGAPLVVSRRVAFAIGSKWKYGRARHYLAVSEFVKSVLVAGGVPRDRISVVYDGVPLLAEQVMSGQAGDPDCGPFRLPHGHGIAPGNVDDPLKGAALAIEGARLAGVKLKLSTSLESDLLHAGFFVYVTHNEGLGSGVLLAMSAGVPVVASKVGGLPEVIRHGENGLLTENTPEAIAATLRRLVEDPALAQRLGEAGRRTVSERFTVDHMVRRTIEVYQQVLK